MAHTVVGVAEGDEIVWRVLSSVCFVFDVMQIGVAGVGATRCLTLSSVS